MLYSIFPISGQIRLPLLIIEWIVFLFSLELGIIFFIRYRRQTTKIRSKEELGYVSLFLGFSLMILFFIKSDYFSSDITISPYLIWDYGSERQLYLNFGYLFLLFGAFLFIYIVEINKSLVKIKKFFTTIFFLLLIMFLILFFIDFNVTGILSLVFWAIFLLFFIIYILDFIKKAEKKTKLWKSVLKYLISFFIIPIGFFLTTDALVNIFGIFIRLIGSLLQIISFSAIFYIFVRLPSLSEINWLEKVGEVFIINKEGACLFYKSYIDTGTKFNKYLISNAITSVKIILNELTSSKDTGTSIIRKENKVVSIYSGSLLTGVIISEEKLENFESYLRKLIQHLERLYYNVLKKWDGDLEIFNPIEDIINEIFSK
ncbi:MAG: hypothetical protein KGD61_11040 [Candidatus Lokiarchaeota archaeon]|nr:hypothetical protein [Candidatus Lokiarchaeota archaeon]